METTKKLTAEEIRAMKTPELIALTETLKVPYTGQKKTELIELLVTANEVANEEEDPTFQFKSELKAVIDEILEKDQINGQAFKVSQDEYRNHEDIVALFEKHLNDTENSNDSDTLEDAYNHVVSGLDAVKKGPAETKGKKGTGKVEKAPKKEKEKKEPGQRGRKAVETEVSAEMKEILDNQESSKSEKIRSLSRLNVSVAQIAKLTNAHYSFAHGVVKRYKEILENFAICATDTFKTEGPGKGQKAPATPVAPESAE